jgi:hypothetical protein
MRRRLLTCLVPGALLGVAVILPARASQSPPPPPTPVPSQCNSVLKVVPEYVHSGDPLHISGSCLLPRHHVDLLISCPTAFDATEMANLNWSYVFPSKGPKTDKHGDFLNFVWPAVRLRGVQQSACTVYTQMPDASTEYGPDIPALYFTLKPTAPLPKCSKEICASISVAPSRVRSGRFVTISVHSGRKTGYTSWPGAQALVTVDYSGATPIHISFKLNWNGAGQVRIRVPQGVKQPSRAQVQVSFKMGVLSGKAQDEFTVVH